MSTSKCVLDTVVLRVLTFGHPQGISILMEALSISRACFPCEVYNQDEDTLPLSALDDDLSELAGGIRYARRGASNLPGLQGQRLQTWLENATQLPRHLRAGSLFIEPLTLEELPRREELMRVYGIGRGEAACLVLAQRDTGTAVFLSSDERACQAAQSLGISFLTIPDILAQWIDKTKPSPSAFQELIDGLRNARFTLPEDILLTLQSELPSTD